MSVIELISELTAQDIRLWLEDGQLRFSAPKGGMSDNTRVLLKQNKSTIIDFLSHSQAATITPLEQSDRCALQPLSYAQERIWFLSQLDPHNTAFHLPIVFELKGTLNIPALGQVLNTIIERHAILRTAYIATSSGTFQKIINDKSTTLNIEHQSTHLNDTDIQSIAAEELNKPFDLENGDITHNRLFITPNNRHLLFLTIHHIATDAWSMAMIGTEIATLYASFAQQKESPLKPLATQYIDFAVWQRKHQQQKKRLEQLEYWRSELSDYNNLDFPTDFPRAKNTPHSGNSLRFTINNDLTTKLNHIAKNQNSTLFVTLLSIFSTLLYRYTQQNTFCIGTPVSGRTHSQHETLVGCFLNLLALKMQHEPHFSFIDSVKANHKCMQAALAHQDIPFEEVVRNIITTRSQSIAPIFQVMFGLQNTPLDNITHIDNINIQTIAITKQSSLYDISMNAKEVGDEIHVELDYKSALFEQNTMQRFIESFMRLTENITTNPEANLNTFEIISPNDAKQQLHEWNNTKKDRHAHPFLHAFIEEQATKIPNATALIYKEDTLSYEALNQQANQLAHHLLSKGIKAGDIIGVLLERNISLIITLLAISKTGACYLPLGLSLPQAKLNAISEDGGIQFIITRTNTSQWLIPKAIHTINIDNISTEGLSTNNINAQTTDKALFNIIYTSGSTGRPKGVMVSHAALINRLLWMQETFPINANDRVLHKTPYGFDVSVWEIFWPLMVGAQLVIAEPNEHRNPNYIHEIIAAKKITVAHFVPSMLSVFLQATPRDSTHYLNTVFCSGETLTPHLADVFFQHYPSTQLVNLYGPTEAAIDVSYHICSPQAKRIPIGKPISNTALHIIDTNNALLPIGAIGELAIAGDGLAEGYLHQQELTERFFIANPFTPNTLLYKTGDLAHYDQQGNLHFVGRNDQQIKVRGFRVELGEIEHTLNAHPDIADSRVYASIDNNNTQAITAYYITKNTISISDIRNHLANALPSFMIPNTFVAITEWPLTTNGKIDRFALPEQQTQEIHHKPFVAPNDDIEKSIAKIWIDLLNVEKIGIHDNFFELGGHSLLATIAITRLQNEYHIKIPLIDIFKEPTIANFAQAIRIAQQIQQHNLQPKSDNEEEFTL